MSRILAIDPGYTQSAWVLFEHGKPVAFAIEPNQVVVNRLYFGTLQADVFAIESVASYGMAVGREVFETCVWSGRMIEVWERSGRGPVVRVYRRDVKLHLCGHAGAKDSNVRAALIEQFGPGKDLAVGTKKTPGPLYGVAKDVWAALGVAVTVDNDAPLSFVEAPVVEPAGSAA